jgi:nucleotide-binding universal stress UspA family protein
MLVPLDGSQLAEMALPYAKELSGRLDLEMVILHVCAPEEQVFNTMHKAYIDQVAQTMAKEATEVQQKVELKKRKKQITTRSEITVGYPAEEILLCANKYKVDFVLLATHGNSGIKQWTISSVADKILRASRIPVLLVRTEIPSKLAYDKWPHITLIVPLDGSKLAESVLPHVEKLAKQRCVEEVDIVLLSVYERHSIPSDLKGVSQIYGWDEYVEQITSELKKTYKQYLDGIDKNLTNSGFKVKSQILMGKAAQKINEFTRKNPFSLVVMATHGRTRYVLSDYGDVTNKVIREGTSPVFLVRTH